MFAMHAAVAAAAATGSSSSSAAAGPSISHAAAAAAASSSTSSSNPDPFGEWENTRESGVVGSIFLSKGNLGFIMGTWIASRDFFNIMLTSVRNHYNFERFCPQCVCLCHTRVGLRITNVCNSMLHLGLLVFQCEYMVALHCGSIDSKCSLFINIA